MPPQGASATRLRIPPPLIALSCLAAAWIVQRAAALPRIVSPPWSWAGILFVLAGLALTAWGAATFRHRATTIDPFGVPSRLVQEGPFRRTRNPMYLGLTSALLGVGLLAGTPAFLLVPVVFAVTIQLLFVPLEERKLARLFGEEYGGYRRRVRRWF
ncbi:MAG: isoprenylcysteine carboxylmethyltransferase family protein [Gemmatimonadota bacterium]